MGLRDTARDLDARLHQRAPQFWRFLKYRFKRGERYGLGLTIAFVLVVAALWAFLAIVEGVVEQSDLFQLDFKVQAFVTSILTPEMTVWVIRITDLGGTLGTVVGTCIVGVVLLFTRRWWRLFGLVFATAGGGLVLRGLKAFFRRARPDDPVIQVPGFSFPSGHAFAAMVFFGYVIYIAWKHVHSRALRWIITILSAVLILLIGLSRVYLNVHFFTDVIGGFTAGFVWLISSILIVHFVEPPLTKP